MLKQKKKEKNNTDKDFQDDVKEVKNLLNEGKKYLDHEEYEESLNVLNRAIGKATSIQVANTYLLYFYRGLCYLKLENLEKAERDFIEASSLADDKGKVQIFNAFGKCKIKMAEEDPSYLQEGIKCFEKAIECSNSKDGESYLNLANIYKRLNNNQQAIKGYSSAINFLKQSPSLIYEAYTNRGLCEREVGDLQESVADFSKALQICEDDPFAHFNLGVNYLLCDQSELAEQKFDHAIELNEDFPQYHNYKGLAIYMNGQYDQCLAVYEHALKLYNHKGIENSEVAECWHNLGNVYLKLNNQQEANRCFDNAKNFSPPHDLLLKISYSQGLAYSRMNDILAIGKFRQCQNFIGNNESHELYESTLFHLGENLHKHKKYELAIDVLSELIGKKCEDQCVYELRGKVYLAAEMHAEALKDFGVILAMNPNYPDVYYHLGKSKSYLGDIDSAIVDFLKAFELGSRNTSILDGISCAYLKSGKPQKALVYANLALEKEPNNEHFLIQRSMVYISLGENQKGIHDLTKSASINSQNPFTYYQRGLAYYKNAQFQSAIKDLKKSFQYTPSKFIQPDICYLIGISYANLEQFLEAVQPLSNAIRLKPEAKYYHERAKCYLLLQENTKALDDLNQVISAQAENAFAYFRRAFAQKALKKYEEAAEDFMKARELAPDDPRLIVNKKQIYNMKYRKLCEPGEQL